MTREPAGLTMRVMTVEAATRREVGYIERWTEEIGLFSLWREMTDTPPKNPERKMQLFQRIYGFPFRGVGKDEVA